MWQRIIWNEERGGNVEHIEEHGLFERAAAPRVGDRHHLAICRFATLPPTDGIFTDRIELCSGHMHLLFGGTTPPDCRSGAATGA